MNCYILRAGKHISPQALYRQALSGAQLDHKTMAGDVSLRRIVDEHSGGAVFRISGPTGIHELAVSCTNAARLYAHWTGFINTLNGE